MNNNDFEAWAEYYDDLYNQKHAENEDADFYRQLIADHEEPALEVACGTGRLLLQYLDEGRAVHGVDISEGMLDGLRERAGEGVSPTLYHGDAAEVDLPHEYGLVYLPFTAVCHFHSLNHQRRLFRNVHRHLRDGGGFAFDLFTVDFDRVANGYREMEREEFTRDGRTYVWETWSTLEDRIEQEFRMHNRVVDTETGVIEWETAFDLALIPKRQIELLFEATGFEEWEFYDGFDRGQVTDETERMACIGWK